MSIILYLALLVLAGFLAAKLLGLVNLPDVTGYLIAGILIGPSVLNLIPSEALPGLSVLSQVALAFIAYNIGCEMDLVAIKKLGRNIILVTMVQAVLTWVLVTGVLMLLGQSFEFALTAGAIACATAPAATLLVIQQYKAKGPLVDTLIPVVALDDAFCIMAFGISSSIAFALLKGGPVSLNTMLLRPVLEIVLAVLLGVVGGVVVILAQHPLKRDQDIRISIIGSILLIAYISLRFNLSSLLALMSFGVVVGNFSAHKRTAREALAGYTPAVYVAFFALSGADLDLKILLTAGGLGLAFFLTRAVGKYMGAFLGAHATGMPKSVRDNLGLTLMPQAGVAIGLSQIAAQLFPGVMGSTMRAIVLAAVIGNEIFGPLLARLGLKRAGDIAA